MTSLQEQTMKVIDNTIETYQKMSDEKTKRMLLRGIKSLVESLEAQDE